MRGPSSRARSTCSAIVAGQLDQVHVVTATYADTLDFDKFPLVTARSCRRELVLPRVREDADVLPRRPRRHRRRSVHLLITRSQLSSRSTSAGRHRAADSPWRLDARRPPRRPRPARPPGSRGRAGARSRRAARAPRPAPPGSSRAERGAEAGDRLAGDRLVEAERGRQRQRVQRAVRHAVAAAEPLGQRVTEREHRRAERGAGVAGAAKKLGRAPRGRPGARPPAAATRRSARAPASASASALGVAPPDVERLGAVRERVQRVPTVSAHAAGSSVSFGS